MLDQEELYSKLAKQDFNSLIGILHKHSREIKSDLLLSQAATVIAKELVRLAELTNEARLLIHLEEYFTLIKMQYVDLDEHVKRGVVIEIVKLLVDGSESQLEYARLYPGEPICAESISRATAKQPNLIAHEQDYSIRLTANIQNERVTNARSPLFKSGDEQRMFLAFKRVFDTYQVYPNVAVSAVVSYDTIKDQLSREEADYFFKSVIDLVVFEPFQSYLPVHFFELDSVWHNSEKAERNDRMKDRIFTVAGLKLLRIRHQTDQEIDEEAFEKLAREIRKAVVS